MCDWKSGRDDEPWGESNAKLFSYVSLIHARIKRMGRTIGQARVGPTYSRRFSSSSVQMADILIQTQSGRAGFPTAITSSPRPLKKQHGVDEDSDPYALVTRYTYLLSCLMNMKLYKYAIVAVEHGCELG